MEQMLLFVYLLTRTSLKKIQQFMKKLAGLLLFLGAVYLGYQKIQKDLPHLPQIPTLSIPQPENKTTLPTLPQKPSSRNRKEKTPPDAVMISTWNLANFGRSKNAEELRFIAKILEKSDVVGIQEVSKTFYGTQAVGALVDMLDRTGTNWDYTVSNATTGQGSERYAFLWKSNKITLARSYLAPTLARSIDREPFVGKFRFKQKNFIYSIFHAVPENKNPALENRQLATLAQSYKRQLFLIGGDFNESASNPSFENLADLGFTPAHFRTLTTIKLRKTSSGRHLANSYDNLWYHPEKMQILDSYVEDFTPKFRTLTDARRISDHLPVHGVFRF